MTLLMKKSLVTEIEAWHAHETLANKTLGRVLAESKRIAVQCAAAERAAGERASAAAAEVSVPVARIPRHGVWKCFVALFILSSHRVGAYVALAGVRRHRSKRVYE